MITALTQDPGLKSKRTQLGDALNVERLKSDQIDDLHKDFSHLYFANKLTRPESGVPVAAVLQDAEELESLARNLKDKLIFDADDLSRRVFSPHLKEIMGMEFFHQVAIERQGDYRVESKDWGLWQRQLASDLAHLQRLARKAQEMLQDGSMHTLAEVDPVTSESQVLAIQASLLKYKPAGRSGGAWPRTIADIMQIYELDMDITEDTVKGILRKHKDRA